MPPSKSFAHRSISEAEDTHRKLPAAPSSPISLTHSQNSNSKGTNHAIGLPAELILQIAEACLADFDGARMASQTASWVRQTILPRVYATPPPLTNIDAVARLPEHVRPFVQNLWLEDPRSFSDACVRQALWLWHTVPNLAIPCLLLSQWCNSGAFERGARAACTHLTILGPDFYFGSGEMPFAFLDAVTHLRFVGINIDIFHLMLMLRMRALDYVAIPLDSSNHDECMACVLALLMHKRMKMVILVLDREMEPEEWVTRNKTAMSIDESLFVVPGAHVLQDVRTEWFAAVAHGDDIWEKARRVREATITENHDEIRKLCALRKSCC